MHRTRSSQSRPSPEQKALIGSLPDAPGVYLFYGAVDELLYVGKSKSIRTRVRAHFGSPEEERMCRRVHRIDVRTTAGELGALLLESELIKKLRPLYNVRSRQKRRIIVARRTETADGYSSVLLEPTESIALENTSAIMAIFKTKVQAKEYLCSIAKTHRLCPKLLRVECTRRHCFSYHLGQCNGACMGAEDPHFYNARFEKAFDDRRIKAWPFTGGILIEESAENNNEGEVFLVDNWCLLYSFTYSLSTGQLRVRGLHRFDYDSYKTLSSYIFDETHYGNLREVSRDEMERIVRDERTLHARYHAPAPTQISPESL